MDTDPLLVLVVVCHLLVTGGYVGLGVFVAPRFDAAAPTWALRIFKAAGLAFFVACAYTHAHAGWHITDGSLPREYWATWHYIGHMAVQAIASLTALVMAFGFMSLRIYDRRYYGPFLDREIDRQAEVIAHRVRSADVEYVASEAKRMVDAAEVILRAMRRDP